MKPILFNTEMVRAILDGRKTVTRRIVKLPRSIERGLEFHEDGGIWWQSVGEGDGGRFSDLGECVNYFNLQPYRPGDILYVRETWSTKRSNDCLAQPCNTGACPYESCETAEGPCFPDEYIYKATDSLPPYGGRKWRPSIHMPREAARIWLRVTDVRVERLRDITDEQATGEGIRYTDFGMYQPSWKASLDGGKTFCPAKPIHHPGFHAKDVTKPEQCFPTARSAFANLWDSTIKPADRERYGWEANPFVWVIEFERCEKPEELT